MRNTDLLTLHSIDAVAIKNVLKILFENKQMPVLQKSVIENCVCNKITVKIINNYFKLLENRNTVVISCRSLLSLD